MKSMNRIDVHNHYLPGMDDGCRTYADAVPCLQAFIAKGYTRFFLTPHTGPTEVCDIRPETTVAAMDEFRRQMTLAGITAQFRPGGELRLSPEIARRKDIHIIPTFGMNTRYVLADLWEPDWPAWADQGVDWLQESGFTVILAHPERMLVMREKPQFIQTLADRGILFQGNLGPLGGSEPEPQRLLAEKFLQDGRYFMLGSDCHRFSHVAVRLHGLERAKTLVGEKIVTALTLENPSRLWV
ncbi:MAG: tyrosine-protein phosphatase [Phycisphaerae bacterium]